MKDGDLPEAQLYDKARAEAEAGWKRLHEAVRARPSLWVRLWRRLRQFLRIRIERTRNHES